MTIDILTPASRQDWLAIRSFTIGASEVAALFGVHPFTSAYELHHLKAGTIKADRSETGPMRRGRHLEQVAINFLAEERPSWTVTANPMPGGKFYRDLGAGLSCTPDAFVIDPERDGIGIAQIKSIEPSVFRTRWKADDGTIEPPLYVATQAIQEAALTGASWAVVCPLVVGFGLEMPILEVPLHLGLIDQIKTRAAEFWQRVAEGRAPDPDYGKDGEIIAALHGSDGRTVDLSADNHLPSVLDEDEQLRDEIKAREVRRKEIRAEVLHKLAGATFGHCGGWQMSNKEQTRAAHHVRESTFNVLRTKRSTREIGHAVNSVF